LGKEDIQKDEAEEILAQTPSHTKKKNQNTNDKPPTHNAIRTTWRVIFSRRVLIAPNRLKRG
jgi:hypothetical protein